ncbi:MAG TPA: fumarylacetoacetate hydrolase family protein [Candidatus Limnocylindrales bacterium]|nr:fumarylacetoacetate hydrolase family protein [Candidatus Limnocylindrales bacterium]
MRLYAYEDRSGDARFGVLARGGLLTAAQLEKRGGLGSKRSSVFTYADVGYQIRHVDDWLHQVGAATQKALRAGAKVLPVDSRRPRPVLDAPGKIVCVGLNYGDHVAEGGRGVVPDRPLLFAKFSNAVVGDGDAIVRPPGTRGLDLEVELGVVIGRRARRVAESNAVGHVAGYVVANDISARDWQGSPPALRKGEKGDGQWLRAKGSDTFLPIGPVFVTPDEVDPAVGLALRSWRIPAGGGEPVLMQDGNTSDMLFTVPQLISYISQQITLEPGDLVITGTPAGVGVFRDPPVFLEPGDRVRCEIEGIGAVENAIVDWTNDPRSDG